MKQMYILLVLPLVTGCSFSGSVSESRQKLLDNPDHQDTFVVQKNYQASYRIVMDKTKGWKMLWIDSYTGMYSRLYTDIQEAEVIHEMRSVLGTRTEFYIKIVAIEPTASKIAMYYRKGKRFEELMRGIKESLQSPQTADGLGEWLLRPKTGDNQ